MRWTQFSLKFVFLLFIVAGLVASFAISPLLRASKIRFELSEGLRHLRLMEKNLRETSSREKSVGASVVTTAWTNTFRSDASIDVDGLHALVENIKKTAGNEIDIDFNAMMKLLDTISVVDPKSKFYIDNIAKPNLELSFESTHRQ